jgi:hypothetical protein
MNVGLRQLFPLGGNLRTFWMNNFFLEPKLTLQGTCRGTKDRGNGTYLAIDLTQLP